MPAQFAWVNLRNQPSDGSVGEFVITAMRDTARLNPDLPALHKSLGEFVIVQELMHMLVANHGRVFKLFMHAYLPDWEERAGRLRAEGLRLEPGSPTPE